MIEKIFSPESYSLLGQWAFGFCKSLVVAAIVYFVGSRLIKLVSKLVTKGLERSKVDPSLFTVLTSIVNVVLWFVLAIIIISIFKITNRVIKIFFNSV